MPIERLRHESDSRNGQFWACEAGEAQKDREGVRTENVVEGARAANKTAESHLVREGDPRDPLFPVHCQRVRDVPGRILPVPRARVLDRWRVLHASPQGQPIPQRHCKILCCGRGAHVRVPPQPQYHLSGSQAREFVAGLRGPPQGLRFWIREDRRTWDQHLDAVRDARVPCAGDHLEQGARKGRGLVGAWHSHLRDARRIPSVLCRRSHAAVPRHLGGEDRVPAAHEEGGPRPDIEAADRRPLATTRKPQGWRTGHPHPPLVQGLRLGGSAEPHDACAHRYQRPQRGRHQHV
mmetsp:Transcript_8684/g.13780  ORF Transcript_8684/g.13780 Transcript_8684/m.13780 type:complete len:293 (+) Transcript_8684:202-1080(+)